MNFKKKIWSRFIILNCTIIYSNYDIYGGRYVQNVGWARLIVSKYFKLFSKIPFRQPVSVL